MMDNFSESLDFPIPDEVKKAIEEILVDGKVNEELTRTAILKLLKGKGGEIRLVKMPGESTGLQVGGYEEGDISALVEIVNENYVDYADFFYEFIPYSEETFRSAVRARPVVFVAKSQTIEGFIACSADWGVRIDMFCVKPGPNRTKIEDILISRVEEEAKNRKVTVWLSSDSRIAKFEKRGYEVYGGFYHLVRSLHNVPAIPPLPEGVTLRGMAKGEEKTITQTFYDPNHVGTSIFKPGFTKTWKEDWNHVAELNGKIIAIICTRPDHKFNAHFNAKRAEIWGPIVLSEHRGKGIEKAFECYALRSLREKEMEVATVWDVEWPPEPTNLEMSLGFRVKNYWKFMRK